MSLDDYAVSSNVGCCWALRLSLVLAFTECPIDSQAEESLKSSAVLTHGRASRLRASLCPLDAPPPMNFTLSFSTIYYNNITHEVINGVTKKIISCCQKPSLCIAKQ